MKADITMRQLWWNPKLMDFFMRSQAQTQLREILDLVQESTEEVLDAIEDFAAQEEDLYTLDYIEEILYNESTEDIIEMFNLTPVCEYEEDED